MATATTEREVLRRLLEELPDGAVAEVKRVLEYLVGLAEHPAVRAMREATPEDPEEDEIPIVEDIQRKRAEGQARYVSHEQARRVLLGER